MATAFTSRIPVENIYYLLGYAWNRLTEANTALVSVSGTTQLSDLFARVLIGGTKHLIRHGLEKKYELHVEEVPSIRGRVALAPSYRRMQLHHGRATCEFDELTINSPANIALKSTLSALSKVADLDAGNRTELQGLIRRLHSVTEVPLNSALFRSIQFHRNNRLYAFLLRVCQLVKDSLQVDEREGQYEFRDFIREPKAMARLFEDFIFRFYLIERADLSVSRDTLKWRANSETDPSLSYLPSMRTDVSIRSASKTVIIDAKYYQETLASYYGSESFHASNLYQLYAYLKNFEQNPTPDSDAVGMLLYPEVDKRLREHYTIDGHSVFVSTVNLSQPWLDLRRELMSIICQQFE